MQNAEVQGEIYPDFRPFITKELRKHHGVYIVHGLSPTPELNMKFQSQAEDDTNGNAMPWSSSSEETQALSSFFFHPISTDNFATK